MILTSLIGVWSLEDAEIFLSNVRKIIERYDMKEDDLKPDSHNLKFFYVFSFTCQGVFNPLCAFMGGFVA